MTMPLAQVQARFHDFVVGDGPVPVALASPNHRASAETRFGVYHNNYRQGLIEALEQDFQALNALLGDDDFRAMGLAYIAAEPSRHYSVRWFGARMAAFVAETAPWRVRPELAELAGWEWALGEAADAADAEPIEASAFAEIAPEDWAGLRFRFHPSLRRLDLSWSVPAYRLAVETGETDPPPAPEKAPGGTVAWAVWRQDVKILYRSLADGEASVLDPAREGASFGALCEMLASSVGDAAASTAAGFLRAWVEQGWITTLENQATP